MGLNVIEHLSYIDNMSIAHTGLHGSEELVQHLIDGTYDNIGLSKDVLSTIKWNSKRRMIIMKTLERQFFRYVCRQIDYDRTGNTSYTTCYIHFIKPMFRIVCDFAEKKHLNTTKQLWYYVEKWTGCFYEYGTGIGSGWFELSRSYVMPQQYLDIIPERVLCKLRSKCYINIDVTNNCIK